MESCRIDIDVYDSHEPLDSPPESPWKVNVRNVVSVAFVAQVIMLALFIVITRPCRSLKNLNSSAFPEEYGSKPWNIGKELHLQPVDPGAPFSKGFQHVMDGVVNAPVFYELREQKAIDFNCFHREFRIEIGSNYVDADNLIGATATDGSTRYCIIEIQEIAHRHLNAVNLDISRAIQIQVRMAASGIWNSAIVLWNPLKEIYDDEKGFDKTSPLYKASFVKTTHFCRSDTKWHKALMLDPMPWTIGYQDVLEAHGDLWERKMQELRECLLNVYSIKLEVNQYIIVADACHGDNDVALERECSLNRLPLKQLCGMFQYNTLI